MVGDRQTAEGLYIAAPLGGSGGGPVIRFASPFVLADISSGRRETL